MPALATAIAAAWLLMGVASADAASLIQYSSDHGVTWNTFAGSVTTSTGVTLVDLGLSSNVPGSSGPLGAFTSSSTTQASTGSSLPAGPNAGDVWLAFSVDSFTTPVTPPSLNESTSIAGNTLGGATGTVLIKSFVNKTLGAPGGATDGGLTGNPVGPTSVTFSDLGSVSFASPTATALISTLTAPYVITQLIELHLAANSTVNLTGAASIASPEPATISLLGFGLAGMAGYGWRRGRKQAIA